MFFPDIFSFYLVDFRRLQSAAFTSPPSLPALAPLLPVTIQNVLYKRLGTAQHLEHPSSCNLLTSHASESHSRNDFDYSVDNRGSCFLSSSSRVSLVNLNIPNPHPTHQQPTHIFSAPFACDRSFHTALSPSFLFTALFLLAIVPFTTYSIPRPLHHILFTTSSSPRSLHTVFFLRSSLSHRLFLQLSFSTPNYILHPHSFTAITMVGQGKVPRFQWDEKARGDLLLAIIKHANPTPSQWTKIIEETLEKGYPFNANAAQ